MSIASKRAKERQNRSSDELVMAETVKLGTLKLAWAVVPLMSGFFRLLESLRDFVAKMDDLGVKIRWILWMERGETWGDARST